MRPLFLTALAAVAMVALASSEPESNPAIRFPSRAERQFQAEQQNSQVLRMPLRRRPPTRVMVPAREDVEERRTRAEPSSTTATATGPNPHPTPNKSNLTAMFQDVAYGIKIWIGTPEQSVILDFDTGSSETWVDPPCTMMEGSGAYEELCRSLGSYIPIASQDGKSVNDTCGPGWISYGSGATYVTYFRDTVTFFDPFDVSGVGNHFKLSKPVQFGVATWAEGMVSGIFGAAYGVGYNQNYSSFIDEIYNQGLVLDKDFSVSLGSVGEEEGEVVFGGIDLKKFVGPLQGIPLSSQLSRQADGYYRYWINVTAISVTRPGSCLSVPVTNSSFSERFLPDTGTTMTYLPEEVFYNLLSYFPDAEPVPSYGYVLNCAHLYDEGGYVSFTFDGITIHVPWNQFIFQVPPIFRDEKDVICILGAVPTDAFFILGDTFLRGAYALFRQQEHKVYLAQYSDCGTHVVSSHGNLTGIVGKCGQDRGHDGGPGDEPYGPPPPPSEPGEEASGFLTGIGTCPSLTKGTYSPLYTTSTDSNGNPLMALTNFPRPAIQTAGRRSGKPLAHPFTVTGVDGSEPTARSTARQTETEDFPTITTGTDTEAPTDMPDMWSTSDCDTDSESITTTGSATAMGSFNPYSFSFSDEKSSFPATNTITDDWSTYTDSISLETNTWVSDATDTATEEATPTAITIPVESSETVIVKMASTTYTIIDGLTQTGDEGEPTTLVPLPLTDLSSATHHRFTSDWPISGHTVSGPWATPFGTETGIWSNSSVVLPTRSAASILGTGVTPASAATATTTDDSDEGGYVTTWAWTPSDDTALPEATEPIPEKKRRRRKRTGSPHRHQQQLAVAEGCSTNTPCLRAMMERRNAVKARGFCHQVLAREQLHDILGAMPVFMQSACREERQGAEAAAIRTACSCLLG